jgi:Icc-related predicted phosphoesterase
LASGVAMRLAWATDLHLNFVSDEDALSFCHRLPQTADVVVISGDTGEADSIRHYLELLEQQLQRPIFFVLGNHDFYKGDFSTVRQAVFGLCQGSDWLHWLGQKVLPLTSTTALIGHDGWADGRNGRAQQSSVWLNDFILIRDLADLAPDELYERLARLGDEAAIQTKEMLEQALRDFLHVVLVTHVPPFTEACRHDGRPTDEDWLPHFSCRALGTALLSVMQAHPERDLTVLCGHTHCECRVEILPNLVVLVGGAAYGHPGWQGEVAVA